MTNIQVFDKPMCCSTGVCGPDVDPALVAFASDLQWLEQQGIQVQRINPVQQPSLFAANALVRQELQTNGNDCLPVIVVNDAVVSRGIFPNRQQLANWTGTKVSTLSLSTTDCCSGEGKSASSKSGCCE